jgi:hypothetical protein
VKPRDFSRVSTVAAEIPARSAGTVTGRSVTAVDVDVAVLVLLVVLKVVVGVGITGTAGVVGAGPQADARVSAAIAQTIRLVDTMFVSVPPTGSSYVTVRI